MFIPIAPPQHFSLLRPEKRNDICDDFLMTFFFTKVKLSHKLCNLSEIDRNFHNPNFQTSKILNISWYCCWSPRFFHPSIQSAPSVGTSAAGLGRPASSVHLISVEKTWSLDRKRKRRNLSCNNSKPIGCRDSLMIFVYGHSWHSF